MNMQALRPSPQNTLFVLLGASEWPYSPTFAPSKAFSNAAMRLNAYLLRPQFFGLPRDNLLDLFNSPVNASEQLEQIGLFLERRMMAMKASQQAARDVIIYFVGHGGFVGYASDFYLVHHRTNVDSLRASGISIAALADIMLDKARHVRRYLLLDCCFAAAAFRSFQGGPDQVAITKTLDAFHVPTKGNGFPSKGTALLCSSDQKTPSLLLPDESCTMFSRALLEALVQGSTQRPEYLSLRDVKELAFDWLSVLPSRNAPRPALISPDQSEGDVADVPFFPNPAASSPTPPTRSRISSSPQPVVSHSTAISSPSSLNVPQQNAPLSIQSHIPSPQHTSMHFLRSLRAGEIRVFLLIFLIVVILTSAFFVLPRLNGSNSGGSGNATPAPSTPVATIPTSGNGIGVTTVNGETIGLSDGSAAFDTSRSDDGSLKSQAATAFASGDIDTAQSLWHSANSKATNDAEPLIYLENQRVKTSGVPSITLIVGTMLTGSGDRVQVGRDDLQGAYIAQKEFNANNGALLGGVEVRLLIANSGSDDVNGVKAVANQIVQAAQKDKTIVGVMGWPYSGQTANAVNILGPAKIPMVSSTASSNQLSGVSPYFFRVVPPDKSQAAVGALYAKQKLNATNVALFEDQSDAYSSSLASGFQQQFTQGGGKVNVVNYTKGNANSISAAMQQALASNPQPDLIYFAGYSSDVNTLLTNLPANSNLQVLGGDALYNLAGYLGVGSRFNRLRFTAFSYPDEWDVLKKTAQTPAFYKDYPATYNPNNSAVPNPYGFTRAGYNVVLAYDATLALLNGSKNGLGGQKQGLTPDKLTQGLASITGGRAIQGASGQIAFDPNTGDPVNKAVLILSVSQDGHIQMEALGAGNLQVGG